MDKVRAYDILSRYKANKALTDEMSEAIGLALEALKPKKSEYIYAILLYVGESKSPLHVEMSVDKSLMQGHLKEWRKKVVDGLNDDFESYFNGSSHNYTTNNHDVNRLPFYHNGVKYDFKIRKYIKAKSNKRMELLICYDRDAVVDIMNELKF